MLFSNSTTKGEKPLQSMQCGISDGSDTQQHGHRDTKAPGCQQQRGGCVCDRSAKGRCLHCSSETLVCVLPAPKDLCPDTRGNVWANSKLSFHSVSSSCTPHPRECSLALVCCWKCPQQMTCWPLAALRFWWPGICFGGSSDLASSIRAQCQ